MHQKINKSGWRRVYGTRCCTLFKMLKMIEGKNAAQQSIKREKKKNSADCAPTKLTMNTKITTYTYKKIQVSSNFAVLKKKKKLKQKQTLTHTNYQSNIMCTFILFFLSPKFYKLRSPRKISFLVMYKYSRFVIQMFFSQHTFQWRKGEKILHHISTKTCQLKVIKKNKEPWSQLLIIVRSKLHID